MYKPIKIALILCLAGVVILLIAFAMNGFKLSGFTKEDYVDKDYTCKNKTEEIILENGLYNVEIKKENVDKVKIEYNDIKDNEQFDIDESGRVLKINKKSEKKWGFFSFDIPGFYYNSYDSKKRDMKITVPEKFEGKMDISSGMGKIKASDLKVEKLDIDLSAGEVDLGDIQVSKEANIKVGAGSLSASKLTADNVKADLSSGNMKFDEVKSNNNIDIKVGAGNVDINKFEAKNNIKLDCSVGSIKGRINGKRADYNIDTDVSLGNCNLFKQVGRNKNLDVKVGGGDIDVDFTE